MHYYNNHYIVSKDLNDQGKYVILLQSLYLLLLLTTTPPTKEKYSQAIQEINSQAADTSFCSDWTNSDNDDSAGIATILIRHFEVYFITQPDAPPKRKVSNTEVVTGKEKK